MEAFKRTFSLSVPVLKLIEQEAWRRRALGEKRVSMAKIVQDCVLKTLPVNGEVRQSKKR